MYEIFEQLLKKRKITPYRVSKETGVPQSTLSDWKRGRSVPKAEKLQKIADYLNVTIDYLLGNEQKEKTSSLDEKKPEDITLDDFTYAFLDESKELTEENKQKLLLTHLNGRPLVSRRIGLRQSARGCGGRTGMGGA